MFHPVNGRSGFDSLPPPIFPPGVCKPPLEKLKAMLKRENDLRLSPEIQAKFSDPSFDAISIAANVQERVVCEFDYRGPDMIKLGLEIIRSAPLLYPEDPEVRNIPHYIKYNRSRRGELEYGDVIPNAQLSYLSGAPVTLFDCLDSLNCKNNEHTLEKERNTVVIACGSYT